MSDPEESSEGVAATHGRRVPLKVLAAPAYLGESHCNTLRPERQPVACWRMNDSRFDFDSSMVLPAARREIEELRRLHEKHAGTLITLFGHADPTGDDEYNKELSGRRARAVYAVLVRRVDLWERLYRDPHGGDQWGTRNLQLILRVLEDAAGEPYYDGPVTGGWSAGWIEAVRHFQTEASIGVDGDPGPETRGALFGAYMDYLRTGRDGVSLELGVDDFLGGGADSQGRMAYQGCGEFNPVMRFSQSEEHEYQAWAKRDERNAKNRINRRVVAFLFRPEHAWPATLWPCPSVDEGSAGCRTRFFSQHGARAAAGPSTRNFDGEGDTLRCRFYHRFAFNSPCEQPRTATVSLDVWLRVPGARSRVRAREERFCLTSVDGSYSQTRSSLEAVPVNDEYLLVRFVGLPPSQRFSLYQEHDRLRFPVFEDVPYAQLEARPSRAPRPDAAVPVDDEEEPDFPSVLDEEDHAEWIAGEAS